MSLSADLTSISPFLQQYGALTVFASVLLETVGGPTPAESLLAIAALLATSKPFWLWHVILAGWAAAVTGGTLGYLAGRYGGRPALKRYRNRLYLTTERIGRIEAMIHGNGALIVVVAQFFPILRQLKGVAAGAAKMSWVKFTAANIIGSGLWSLSWAGGAYVLGQYAPGLSAFVEDYALILFALPFALALLVGAVVYLRGRKSSLANLRR